MRFLFLLDLNEKRTWLVKKNWFDLCCVGDRARRVLGISDMMMQSFVVYIVYYSSILDAWHVSQISECNKLWPHCTVLVIRTLIVLGLIYPHWYQLWLWHGATCSQAFCLCGLSDSSLDGRVEQRIVNTCGTGHGWRLESLWDLQSLPLLRRQAHEIMIKRQEK
jgi:hypothetical protein